MSQTYDIGGMKLSPLQYYQYLRAQGMSGAQAMQMAFPQGIQSQEQMNEDAANKEQNNALAQTGGAIGGLLLTDAALKGSGSTLGKIFASKGAEAAASEAVLPAAEAASTGGLSLGGAASNLGSLGGLAGAGVGAGVLGGVALGAKGLSDLIKGKETQGIGGWGGRATLGIATGGLSELARAFGLGHKSTKDYQSERWGDIGGQNPGWSDVYNKVVKTGHESDGVWDSGKYAGQKWSFDKALDLAKDNPLDFDATLGNAEAFGDKWHGLNTDQRKSIISQLIADNQYYSNKGDILIKDKNRALDIFNAVMNNQKQQAITKPGQSLANAFGLK